VSIDSLNAKDSGSDSRHDSQMATVTERADLEPAELIERALQAQEGQLTDQGALVVATGAQCARQPLDRFIVREPSTSDAIDWGANNQPFKARQFDELWTRASQYLADADTYTSQLHAGQDPEHYLPLLLKTETAWHSLFGQTLYHSPNVFNPKGKETWSLLHAATFRCEPARDGTHSHGVIIINFARRKILIAGMPYAGEIKQAVFTVQNFLLPEKDVLPMHCAANIDQEGTVSLFFGLSGTGKTTLSADPTLALIGDDQHGWGKDTVFNLENGCYAKCFCLDPVSEPLISQAIGFRALLENVVIDPLTRQPIFADDSLSDNGRATYPLTHIPGHFTNARAPEPATIIFLTCDVSGVLPLVATLSPEAAAYHFLSGYTADLGMTPRGHNSLIDATFSACFGAPFLPRPAAQYIDLFLKRLTEFNAQVYLVNTGWQGGNRDSGQRISLPVSRQIIAAIQNGEVSRAPKTTLQPMNLDVPISLTGIDPVRLDPRACWSDTRKYDAAADQLAQAFAGNIKQFDISDSIINAGPLGQPS
jgi:phosphoenolpyruvate carboxykinase (ATP)